MDRENYIVIYCDDDGEYRIYCSVCDELCIERYYKNHLNINCTENENNIEIIIPLFTIIPCGMSLICFLSLMV